ncbi:hypothetical protein, partial [Burkholderia stabilis]
GSRSSISTQAARRCAIAANRRPSRQAERHTASVRGYRHTPRDDCERPPAARPDHGTPASGLPVQAAGHLA